MKRVKVAELKDHLSTYLRAVEHGVTIEVTNRERPVAHIVQARPQQAVKWIPAEQPLATIRDRKYPAAKLPFDIVDLLLEDRRKR